MDAGKRNFGLLMLTLLVYACVEPYDPPLRSEDVNLLVVDGFLNATEDRALVKLTRTLPVGSTDAIPAESGAVVWIEDDQGTAFLITETSPGRYEGNVPGAGTNAQYRLLIRTGRNREYASELVHILETPPIDSITYSGDPDGVQFEVNMHDPFGTSRNYRWTFEETYEYKARFNSQYMFEGEDLVIRRPDQSIYTCWRTDPSTDIIVGTTKHLKTSIVSKFPITFVPKESPKISVEYSLLLRQQALTDEAYDYWLNLERTTEHLGGLFDPLPSEVKGNLRSVTDPSETVIGFFDAATVQQQRIFVKRNELPPELTLVSRYNTACELDTIPVGEISQVYKPTTFIVDAVYGMGPFITGYTSSVRSCVDCTTSGGTTEKPSFWE